jgi:S-(hydroxymethyl)glutathione dehydrogenase/alcohol dehydrogenase
MVRAAVAYRAGQPLSVEEVDLLPLGPRDVLVRVAASGICHTDLSVIAGVTPLPMPLIPGHEGCGTVEEVGADVRRARIGDRVLASVAPACGVCWWCVRGLTNRCDLNHDVMSIPRSRAASGEPAISLCGCGTFAEAMVVHEASIVPVHTDLADEELALLGCGVTTGLGAALNTAGITPGSSVAVIGCGGVGQSVVQGARIAGASIIVAVDPSASRRAASARVGATHTVDPTSGDPVGQIRALTAGRGVDFSFEVVGRPELMLQAYEMARPAGTVTLVGMPATDSTLMLSAFDAVFSGKRLAGSVMGDAHILSDFSRFIGLAETGQLDLGSLVSDRIALDDINEGVQAAERGEGVRTVILPSMTGRRASEVARAQS